MNGVPTQNATVETLGLHFAYPRRAEARGILSDVSLSIKPGEAIALQGASGSGKSTLLSLLGLLNRPKEGQLRLFGEDTARWDEDQRCLVRATRLGFVFQHHFLLPELTALENVGLAQRIVSKADDRPRLLLERLGLGAKLCSFPRELSGGEQQRVALARAVVNSPSLILADEPTGNLDSLSGARVLELLEEQRSELSSTLIIATHSDEVAQCCTRRLVLCDGRIVSDEMQ